MSMDEKQQSVDVASLWQRYAVDKDVELRNQLAEYYLPLVKITAGRLAISLPPQVDRDDLLSSGFFGLLDAIDRYDLQRSNKFETYASVRVRGAMLDYLRAKDWVPVSTRQKIRKYEQAVCALEHSLGRSATDAELAEQLGISRDELQDLERQVSIATVIPLDDYLRADAQASDDAGPSTRLEKQEEKKLLADGLEQLPPKETQGVTLSHYEEMTLTDISLAMHLAEARISQLHTKAVFRLRAYMARD